MQLELALVLVSVGVQVQVQVRVLGKDFFELALHVVDQLHLKQHYLLLELLELVPVLESEVVEVRY
jgi:hypothetical protein